MSDGISPQEAIPMLEELWDFDGFFGRLRQGIYDRDGAGIVERLLEAIVVDDETQLPRRFVSMTWWLPMFIEWQSERVAESGGDVAQLKRDAVRLRNALDRVLGVP
jgi:hypothetical protein